MRLQTAHQMVSKHGDADRLACKSSLLACCRLLELLQTPGFARVALEESGTQDPLDRTPEGGRVRCMQAGLRRDGTEAQGGEPRRCERTHQPIGF